MKEDYTSENAEYVYNYTGESASAITAVALDTGSMLLIYNVQATSYGGSYLMAERAVYSEIYYEVYNELDGTTSTPAVWAATNTVIISSEFKGTYTFWINSSYEDERICEYVLSVEYLTATTSYSSNTEPETMDTVEESLTYASAPATAEETSFGDTVLNFLADGLDTMLSVFTVQASAISIEDFEDAYEFEAPTETDINASWQYENASPAVGEKATIITASDLFSSETDLDYTDGEFVIQDSQQLLLLSMAVNSGAMKAYDYDDAERQTDEGMAYRWAYYEEESGGPFPYLLRPFAIATASTEETVYSAPSSIFVEPVFSLAENEVFDVSAATEGNTFQIGNDLLYTTGNYSNNSVSVTGTYAGGVIGQISDDYRTSAVDVHNLILSDINANSTNGYLLGHSTAGDEESVQEFSSSATSAKWGIYGYNLYDGVSEYNIGTSTTAAEQAAIQARLLGFTPSDSNYETNFTWYTSFNQLQHQVDSKHEIFILDDLMIQVDMGIQTVVDSTRVANDDRRGWFMEVEEEDETTRNRVENMIYQMDQFQTDNYDEMIALAESIHGEGYPEEFGDIIMTNDGTFTSYVEVAYSNARYEWGLLSKTVYYEDIAAPNNFKLREYDADTGD